MVRLTDRLDMTITVDWDVKPQNNKVCKRDRNFQENKSPQKLVISILPNEIGKGKAKNVSK